MEVLLVLSLFVAMAASSSGMDAHPVCQVLSDLDCQNFYASLANASYSKLVSPLECGFDLQPMEEFNGTVGIGLEITKIHGLHTDKRVRRD